MKVIIVGNGMAGNEVAAILRRFHKDIAITLISGEGFPKYNPCSLPYFVGGDVSREMVFSKSITDYEKNGINLILNTKIVELDTRSKKVISESGRKYTYDYLVLAYGADPNTPPIKGINKSGIFYCTRLTEFEKLHKATTGPVVVIGSGAVGIEVAEALRKQKREVSVVEICDWILPGLFDRVAAKLLEKDLRGYKINVFSGERVEAITGDNFPTAVVTNYRSIPCSSVVIAAGITPNINWLSGSGIRVDQGILVDEFMQTSVSGIYACGDCAETKDAFTGEHGIFALKHNAIKQAQVAAKNILGEKTSYIGSSTIVRVSFFNTHSVSFGIPGSRLTDKANIEVIEKQTSKDYLKIIMEKGYIRGFQAIGSYAWFSGFFLDFMNRNDNIIELRENWNKRNMTASPHQWIYYKIGYLLGFNLGKNSHEIDK